MELAAGQRRFIRLQETVLFVWVGVGGGGGALGLIHY